MRGGDSLSPGDEARRIRARFEQAFERWSLRLPPTAVAKREGGHLYEAGWHIGFLWGEDEGGLFLEYLAQHRMTDDRHVRIYADGREEWLEAASGLIGLPAGCSAEERRRIEAEAAAKRRRIYRELREKGLLPPHGQNLPALGINEALQSGPAED